MGTATGGGNSQMESYRLPNSGVTLVMGWSAKYRPNGQLYDGVGIAPDIQMPATARDLIGETDTVLDAALRRRPERLRILIGDLNAGADTANSSRHPSATRSRPHRGAVSPSNVSST